MPFLKKGDDRVQPGDWDQPADFYTVDPTLDSAGGVINPADTSIHKTFAYMLFCNYSPFNSLELPDAERLVGATWATISIPYFPGTIPRQGMRLVLKATGEEFEIRGVSPLSYSRRKVELTCKLVE